MAEYNEFLTPLTCNCSFDTNYVDLELGHYDIYGNAADLLLPQDMVTVNNVPVLTCTRCGLSRLAPKSRSALNAYFAEALIRALPDRKHKWYGLDYAYLSSTLDIQLQNIEELPIREQF